MHNGIFPVFMYNLGMKKLLIQDTLSCGKQYIYEIPKDETFVSHIQINKSEDISFFNNDNLKLEACSRFAFLTLD